MIYFRADSNSQIASGHVMRCLSIANEFRSRGYEVTFILADDNPREMVSSAGFPLIVLNSSWEDLNTELETMQKILRRDSESVLIVDTYKITKSYVETLASDSKICYLGSKHEYLGPLKVLINYSTDIDYTFYEQSYSDQQTKLLLGPGFAPLRKEFQNVHHVLGEQMRHVLITTGNTDPDNAVGYILKSLSELDIFPKLIFDIVVGRMFVHKDELAKEFTASNIVQHYNVTNMAGLMKKSDLAISANGTTVYELVASHVPTITFAMVEEQKASAEALNSLGAVDYCGQMYSDIKTTVRRISERLLYYYNHSEERIRKADHAGTVISGDGCAKIVDQLLGVIHS